MFTFIGPQTVPRAELIAIRESLRLATEKHRNKTIYVYSDSLTSLYLILRWIHKPNTLKHHLFRPILEEIGQLLDAHVGDIHLCKVKAHSDIFGNEIADALAVAAAKSRLKSEDEWEAFKAKLHRKHVVVEDGPEELDDTDETAPGGWSFSHYDRDTHEDHDVRDRAAFERMCRSYSFRSAIEGDASSQRATRHLLEHVARSSLSPVCDESWPNILQGADIWATHTDAELTTLFQHLYNRVYTTNSYGHPLKRQGILNNCPACNDGIDSAAHIRGACQHELVKSEYNERHNHIVSLCAKAMKRSERGYRHIHHDPGARCALHRTPRSSTTVPPEIYSGPSVHSPDIVAIDSLDFPTTTLSRDTPLSETSRYTVNLLDVCVVASDEQLEAKCIEKITKYTPLVQHLTQQGHVASFTPIAIGSRVPVTSLTELPVECDDVAKLRRQIWYSTIRSLRRIQVAFWQSQSTPRAHGAAPAIPTYIRSKTEKP